MALFTTTSANACTVTRCESNQIDGVHSNYFFAVNDANGLPYEWFDNDLAAGATSAQIKTAVSDYLKTIEKRAVPPVESAVPDAGTIVGSKVSDIS